MTNAFHRRKITLAISSVCLGVIAPLAIAQTNTTSDHLVEIPLSRIEQIEAELDYLRQRDSQHRVHEDSVRQSESASSMILTSSAFDSSATESSEPIAYDPCGCQCNACTCPAPSLPCIDCPHVSTLNSNYNVYVFGAVKLDMLFNNARPVSPGVPFFLAPDSLTGLSQRTVDIHARQTTLGASLVGPQVGDFQAGGTFIAMLFNDNVLADKYGFLPLQAFGELKNSDWRFAAGLQFDVFAPGVPTMLPFSALAASGNAGNSFRGSVRLERYFNPASDVQWTIQGALSDPITTTISPSFSTNEDNGWPNVEGRIALGLGELQGSGAAAARPFELGVSSVVGQIRTTPLPPASRVVANVWGFATDARWRMTNCFGFMGEMYTGQTLGTYNGAILQTVNSDTLNGIRSTGGWIEVYYYLTPKLHSHTGYGVDNPLDRDVSASADALGRVSNSTIYTNLIWDISPSLRVASELTWRETTYRNALIPSNEGLGYQSQMQWAF